MKKKANRLDAIKMIISSNEIGSQEDLLQALGKEGFELTQATLSRDLKQLRIAKVPGSDGSYVYIMPEIGSVGKLMQEKLADNSERPVSGSFISINFSGNLAVIKTRPGYAGSLAYDIDSNTPPEVLGTIAGDDTVLVILEENINHQQAMLALSPFMPDLHK